MASPYEISSLEEDLLEDCFDVRFNIVRLIPPHLTTISSPLFESPFIMSCQELLQDVLGFLRRALSHTLYDEDIQLLASQLTSYAQSIVQHYRLNYNTSETTHHSRLMPLSVDVLIPPYPDEEEDEDPDTIIIDQTIQQSMLQAVSMVPASENAIASLKKVHVTRERCSICLEDFEEDDDGVLGMPCQHVYHKDCIVQWLKTSHMCPLCRFKMPVQ